VDAGGEIVRAEARGGSDVVQHCELWTDLGDIGQCGRTTGAIWCSIAVLAWLRDEADALAPVEVHAGGEIAAAEARGGSVWFNIASFGQILAALDIS
jgi:hypothetical protein